MTWEVGGPDGTGGIADPDDVAPFVVWLCTDAAAVNGHDFAVREGHVGLYSQPVEIKIIDKEGRWTLDELDRQVPISITSNLVNPAPSLPPKE